MTVMTDEHTSLAISLRVEDEPAFMLLLTKEGLVKRMGSSNWANDARPLAVGEKRGVFEEVLAAIPPPLLARAGTYTADGSDGQRCDWQIELSGGAAPVTFHLRYHDRSAGLPKAIHEVIAKAEKITDGWYSEQLDSAVAPQTTPVLTEGVEHTNGRPEETPEPVADGPAKAEAARPRSSKKRIAFAVLLDLMVLAVPYTAFRLLVGASETVTTAVPPGGGIVLFVLVEFVLLQFVRRSPGLWLLGIRAPLGSAKTVDPRMAARESFATHVAGYVLLGWGLQSLTAWIAYQTPVPYFGFEVPAAVSIILSIALGALMAVSGVLILRTDMRGAWLALGNLALTVVMVVTSWSLWPRWATREVAAQAALDASEVPPGFEEFLTTYVHGALVGFTAVLALWTILAWRRLRKTTTAAAA